MAKTTTTRAVLRRMIGLALGMPFYRTFGATYATFTGGSSSAPIDTGQVLTGPWNNAWAWLTDSDGVTEARHVEAFNTSDYSFTLDRPMTASPTGVLYELLAVFSPHEIHQAIDMALDKAYPAFFDVVLDQSLVVCHDKLEYSLAAFSTAVRVPLRVWVERSNTIKSGTADSATSTTLVDADVDMSDVTSSWYVSIYDGTGAGQVRAVSSVTGHELTVATWTTTPDATSKYKLWNPAYPGYDWYELTNVRFDIKEGPTLMSFADGLNSFEGMRLRVQYVASPAHLATDAALTYVPSEYIVNAALAILASTRLNDNQSTRSKFQIMFETNTALAETYKKENAWRFPSMRMQLDQDPGLGKLYAGSDGDPLGWHNG